MLAVCRYGHIQELWVVWIQKLLLAIVKLVTSGAEERQFKVRGYDHTKASGIHLSQWARSPMPNLDWVRGHSHGV